MNFFIVIVFFVFLYSCYKYDTLKIKKTRKQKCLLGLTIFFEFGSLITLGTSTEASFGYSLITLTMCIFFLRSLENNNKKEKNEVEEKTVANSDTATYCKSNEDKMEETNELSIFNENINENFSVDYLNTKLEDGLTIKEHMQQGYLNVLEKEKNSINTKYHRSPEEEELSFEFTEKHDGYITKLEDIIYGCTGNENCSTIEEIKKSLDKCNKGIDAYYELKEFCYKFKGGKIYFQDMWECCDNSKNDYFEYVEQLNNRKDYLLQQFEEIDVEG